MKTTMYMAITANGFIGHTNHDTGWVCDTDWDELLGILSGTDAVILGR